MHAVLLTLITLGAAPSGTTVDVEASRAARLPFTGTATTSTATSASTPTTAATRTTTAAGERTAPTPVAAHTSAPRSARSDIPVRVELGTRTGAWVGAYAAPGIGGDLELTVADAVGVDLYSDHFAMIGAGLRHDHIIGFSLFTPQLLRWADGFVSPTFGACVDFRFEDPDDAPSSSTVLFGVHAGAMAKVFALYDFSFQLSAEGHLYTGSATDRSGWTVRPTEGLGAHAVAVVTGGLGYAL